MARVLSILILTLKQAMSGSPAAQVSSALRRSRYLYILSLHLISTSQRVRWRPNFWPHCMDLLVATGLGV